MTELNPDIIFEMACSGDLSKIQEMLDDLDGDRLRPNDHIYLEYGLVAGRQGMGADSGVGGAAIAIRICPPPRLFVATALHGLKKTRILRLAPTPA